VNDYLETCANRINEDTKAIFANLLRLHKDFEIKGNVNKENLTIDNFLIGNPGVQGSNMFFNAKALSQISGFDETLNSCTDRDLMIRFLQQNSVNEIAFVNETLVSHYAQSENTITNNSLTKWTGLDSFYNKYLNLYTHETLEKSLKRAKEIFAYPNGTTIRNLFNNSQRNILITGVCGFIGSYLAKKLVELKYKIIGIDNLSTGTLLNIKGLQEKANFQFQNIDILDNISVSKLFDNHYFDCIFHLAALPRIGFSFAYPNETYNANVTGTRKLVDIAQKNNVRKFVFASSSSVYGIQQDEIFVENNQPNPISPYAEQKLLSENYIKNKCKSSNFNALILRFFNVYGFYYSIVNEFTPFITRIISALTNDFTPIIYNDGAQQRDFTYVDDVINAMLQALKLNLNDYNGTVINIGRNEKQTINHVYDLICKALHKKVQPQYLALPHNEPYFTCANNSKAKELLNWQPAITIEKSIAETVKHFLDREKIVLAMPMCNSVRTIRRAVMSIVTQKNVRRQLILVIGNDNSIDNWQQQIEDLISDNIIIMDVVDGGKSYKVRNAINEYILNNLKNIAYIGRLDADDELADESVISRLEQIMDNEYPDVILAGNYQRYENEIVGLNIPTKNLLLKNYLLKRLYNMSLGIFEAELPYCNIFIRPECMINYPPKESAEDHWFTAELLLNSNNKKVHIAEDFIYSIYSISGCLTKTNKRQDKYLHSRKELYEYVNNNINGQKR
jgi:UDP-N-acetylglucosamine 4-epimerase